MANILTFGTVTQRTPDGYLLGAEIERISGFLRFRGTVVLEGLGGVVVFTHPDVPAKHPAVPEGFQARRVLIGASIEQLRREVELGVGVVRALEALSPGSLVVAATNDGAVSPHGVCVPQESDLRDIASNLGGTMPAVLITGPEAFRYTREWLLRNATATTSGTLGIIQPSSSHPTTQSRPTVVRILAPGSIDCLSPGGISVSSVIDASRTISQWEMSEWT